MAVDRDELIAYLERRLDLSGPDYGPNGLQVEGASRIQRLAVGVSACRELFDRAKEWNANAVLVHHGVFWEGMSRVLTGVQFRRVKVLVEGDLNLIACHLPLDRHPEIGNNSIAARQLGLQEIQPFGEHHGQPIGFSGRFSEPVSIDELTGRCRQVFDQDPLVLSGGSQPISTLGVISGGADKEFHQAVAAGLDAYITGEASEWVMNWAREAGVHYLAAGHYATERLGVKALGEELATKFDLEVEFFDVPNPV